MVGGDLQVRGYRECLVPLPRAGVTLASPMRGQGLAEVQGCLVQKLWEKGKHTT